MATILKPHQYDAIQKLRNGSILVGGVGSGKSRTSIGYFFERSGGVLSPVKEEVDGEEEIVGYKITKYPEKPVKTLVIITTARKRDTFEWEEELALYSMSTSKDINRLGNEVIVDSWNNIQKYISVTNAFFIFDEQRVGGTGKWAKTFIKITKSNRWILLSATPGDTWSDYAPVFIANGFYKNFTEFRQRHCVYNRYAKYPKIDHYVETGVLEARRNYILVTMHFSRKTHANYEIVKVDYDKALYEKASKNRWNVFKNEPCQEIAELCSVLRKITNSDPSRNERLLDILQEHSKLIVFYNFDYELESLRALAEENGIVYSEWNGKKHEPIPETDSWLYLVQYRAGAEGWNCIVTDTIVFYSQTYSYKDFRQSAGRIDRLNTPFTELYYYTFVSASKIDVGISRCLKNKKDFNEKSFIEGGMI